MCVREEIYCIILNSLLSLDNGIRLALWFRLYCTYFQGCWLKCYLLSVLQSRLRKQDVGLKTHLQQLDQQISELKLDVSKASTEQLESDSRPSSGV